MAKKKQKQNAQNQSKSKPAQSRSRSTVIQAKTAGLRPVIDQVNRRVHGERVPDRSYRDFYMQILANPWDHLAVVQPRMYNAPLIPATARYISGNGAALTTDYIMIVGRVKYTAGPDRYVAASSGVSFGAATPNTAVNWPSASSLKVVNAKTCCIRASYSGSANSAGGEIYYGRISSTQVITSVLTPVMLMNNPTNRSTSLLALSDKQLTICSSKLSSIANDFVTITADTDDIYLPYIMYRLQDTTGQLIVDHLVTYDAVPDYAVNAAIPLGEVPPPNNQLFAEAANIIANEPGYVSTGLDYASVASAIANMAVNVGAFYVGGNHRRMRNRLQQLDML